MATVTTMSLERVLRALEGFGLSRVESEVYVYLAKSGPSKTEELCECLRIPKQQLYRALKGLEKKGIVTSKAEPVALFSALAFEELVNRYVRLNVEQAKIIKETKQQLLDSWRSMTKENNA